MHGALVFFLFLSLLSLSLCYLSIPAFFDSCSTVTDGLLFFMRFYHQQPNLCSFGFWEVTDGMDEGRHVRQQWFCVFWVAFERLGGLWMGV